MNQNHTETVAFKSDQIRRDNIKQILKQVKLALEDRGYNAVNQLSGYLISNDPAYISSHQNARSIIQTVERYEIIEELVRAYLDDEKMRSIALDVGTKTVGVAISDLSGFLASPLVTFRFESEDYDHALDQIEALLKEYPANAIILGYPKHMNGSIGDGGRRSEFFKEEIEKFTETPVILWDERLTTVSAHKTLLQSNMRNEKRKKVVDQVAAVTMLQEYLDQQRQKEQVNGRK